MRLQATVFIEVDDERFEDFQEAKDAIMKSLESLSLDIDTEEIGANGVLSASIDWDTLMETSIHEKKLKEVFPHGPEFR